jgi:hypothetical protein
VSVDTYLKGKNLNKYEMVEQDGLQILIPQGLGRFAKRIELDAKKFLVWKSFDVWVEVKHAHGPT